MASHRTDTVPSRRGPSPFRQLSIAGLAAVAVSFGFARYGYGLFLPEMRAEFGLSISMMGVISSATYVGYLVALVLVGVLIERLGPRTMVALGGASATVGTGLVAVAPGPWVLAAGLVLAGTSPGWIWAPYSDAAKRMLPPQRRERVLALIPTGTAVGVAVAGPLAVLAQGPAWRYAWVVFAAGSLAATAYNICVLPAGRDKRVDGSRPQVSCFARVAAVPLFGTALSYGVVGSVYWLLAVEAISDGAGAGRHTAALFWTLMGTAGLAGAFAGIMFDRIGLRRSQALLFASLAVAVALLGVAPGAPGAVALSAILYGPAFMAVSALLAVWSYQIFPEWPTAGFSVTVFFLAGGTIAGPVIVGGLADRYGISAAFLLTAVIALLTIPVRLASRQRWLVRLG